MSVKTTDLHPSRPIVVSTRPVTVVAHTAAGNAPEVPSEAANPDTTFSASSSMSVRRFEAGTAFECCRGFEPRTTGLTLLLCQTELTALPRNHSGPLCPRRELPDRT